MIKLDEYEIDPAIIALVPRDLCERHSFIPVLAPTELAIVAEGAIRAAVEGYCGAAG